MSHNAPMIPGLPNKPHATHRPGLSAKTAAGIGATVLLAASLVAIPLAQPASAADLTIHDVDTDAEYRAALADCAAGTPGDTCTIEITGSFAVDGAGGIPASGGFMDIVLVGVGGQHSITRTGALVPFFRASGARNITVENLAFSGFSLTNEGGVVFSLTGPNLTLQDVAMSNNTSNTAQWHGAEGGAIRSLGGDVTILDSTFNNNFADGNQAQAWSGTGGVVFTSLGDIHIERSRFTNNGAERGGGAVSVWSGAVTIIDSTFMSNYATWGGAVHQSGGVLTVTGSTFTGNTAEAGGALFIDNDTTITNSTFNTNIADTGGAIYANFDPVMLNHVTLSNNAAATSGAHLHTHASHITIRHSLLDWPLAGSACSASGGGVRTSGGYNWATNTQCVNGSNSTDVVNGTDAQVGLLADNGGATATQLPSWTSPLRDAIPLSEAAPATDQRGVTRAQGAGFDIGAVEVAIPSVTFQVDDTRSREAADFTVDLASAVDQVDWHNPSLYSTALPLGLAAPLGIMTFELDVPAPGETAAITAQLPRAVTEVWADVNGTWIEVTDAVIAGTTVTYDVTDGGALDSDGDANGVVVHRVLFGVDAADVTIPNVDSDSEFRDALLDCEMVPGSYSCTIQVTGPFGVDAANGTSAYVGLADLSVEGVGGQHDVTVPAGVVGFLASGSAVTITVENLNFEGFSSLDTGGAVFNLNGPDLVLRHVAIRQNSSNINHAYSADGGAIRSTAGDVSVYDSVFSENSAGGLASEGRSGYGGAIYTNSGAIHIERSSFSLNVGAISGGAVSSAAGEVTVEDSTFSSNSAYEGGAISVGFGVLTVSGSTFDSNYADNGGAVWALAPTTITNSTFTSNSAERGGVLYAASNMVTLNHVTVLGNSVTLEGADIYAHGANVTLRASVLAGASGAPGCSLMSGGEVHSAGYNWATNTDCLDGTDPTDVTDGTDPMLGALADNGGATHTMLPAWTSPLRDAIPLSETAPATDQRGVARAQGAGFDIGAVEVVVPSVTFTVFNNTADAVAEFTVDGATSVDEVEWFAISGYTPVAPAGVAGPLGIMGFELTVPASGESVTVTAVLPQPVTQVWKDVNGTWVRVTDAVIVGTTVTYVLVDGGPLDSDGAANGVIVDPVLFGVGASFTG